MSTKEFIEKALRGQTKRSSVGSVVAISYDSNQEVPTIYSYGTHYPLVKIIDGKAYINDRGYSVTTSKHITWAFRAAANIVGWGNCYHAPLVQGGGLNKLDIARNTRLEYDRLTSEMASKKRKDTRVYAWLEVQRDRMSATIEAIGDGN